MSAIYDKPFFYCINLSEIEPENTQTIAASATVAVSFNGFYETVFHALHNACMAHSLSVIFDKNTAWTDQRRILNRLIFQYLVRSCPSPMIKTTNGSDNWIWPP